MMRPSTARVLFHAPVPSSTRLGPVIAPTRGKRLFAYGGLCSSLAVSGSHQNPCPLPVTDQDRATPGCPAARLPDGPFSHNRGVREVRPHKFCMAIAHMSPSKRRGTASFAGPWPMDAPKGMALQIARVCRATRAAAVQDLLGHKLLAALGDLRHLPQPMPHFSICEVRKPGLVRCISIGQFAKGLGGPQLIRRVADSVGVWWMVDGGWPPAVPCQRPWLGGVGPGRQMRGNATATDTNLPIGWPERSPPLSHLPPAVDSSHANDDATRCAFEDFSIGIPLRVRSPSPAFCASENSAGEVPIGSSDERPNSPRHGSGGVRFICGACASRMMISRPSCRCLLGDPAVLPNWAETGPTAPFPAGEGAFPPG